MRWTVSSLRWRRRRAGPSSISEVVVECNIFTLGGAAASQRLEGSPRIQIWIVYIAAAAGRHQSLCLALPVLDPVSAWRVSEHLNPKVARKLEKGELKARLNYHYLPAPRFLPDSK